jgi:hypothetical protein
MSPIRLVPTPLDDLVAAPVNPKGHALDVLDRSYERFGFMEPIRVDERTGRVNSGHGRVEQLRARRDEGREPPEGVEVGDDGAWLVPVVRGWSSRDDAHAHAALIASNRITETGGWDDGPLLDQLREMDDELLAATGFDDSDLDDISARLEELTFTIGGPREGPVYPEPAHEERQENYRNKQVRSFIFDYPLDAYVQVAADLRRWREARGVPSNAELMQLVAREWCEANPEAVAS